MKDYPKPGSEKAIAQGCKCDPAKRDDPNWEYITPGCPIHGGMEYMLWYMLGKRAQSADKRS